MNPVDPAEDLLSGASVQQGAASHGEALKNGTFGAGIGWFVANTSPLARERFRVFKENVKRFVPGWDEAYTLLLVSEAVMEPREHMSGVKALEIAFNTILRMNAGSLGRRVGNQRMKLSERVFGARLLGYGVSAEQEVWIHEFIKARQKGEEYDLPLPEPVGGRFKHEGSART